MPRFTKISLDGPTKAIWLGDELPGETYIVDQLDKTPINEMTAAISTYTHVPTATFTLSSQSSAVAFTTTELED